LAVKKEDIVMKKIFIGLIASALFFVSGSAVTTAETKEKEPKSNPAIDFTLQDINDKDVKLSTFKDKNPVLIVFWTTWCPSCVAEIPELVAAHKKYKDKGLVILSVNIKESKNKVKSFVEKKGVTHTVLLDSKGTVSKDYKVFGIPTNVVVDKKGNVVYYDNPFPPEEIIKKILK
jgi:peroxiredoxin